MTEQNTTPHASGAGTFTLGGDLEVNRLGYGQANVKKYNRYLRDPIVAGRAVPSQIFSHEVLLDEAPDAYDKFDKRIDGHTKVLVKPGMAA